MNTSYEFVEFFHRLDQISKFLGACQVPRPSARGISFLGRRIMKRDNRISTFTTTLQISNRTLSLQLIEYLRVVRLRDITISIEFRNLPLENTNHIAVNIFIGRCLVQRLIDSKHMTDNCF